MSSTVKDVMSTHVIAVRPAAGYKEIAAMLREQRVSAFPVIDADNKVIGIVSETDLLAKEALEGTVPGTLQRLTHQRERSRVNAVTAADLMTRPAVSIGPDEPVSHAARLMYSKRVKRLPVVRADGTLIGIVTRSDVLSVYRRPDAAIESEITNDLILGTFRCDPSGSTSPSRTASSPSGAARKRPRPATTSSPRSGAPKASSRCATSSATRPIRPTTPWRFSEQTRTRSGPVR